MNITAFTHSDLPGLLAVFNQARAAQRSFTEKTYSMNDFMAVIEGEEILVARVENTLAGFISVWKPERFIHHLFVAPRYQNQGVGRALIAETQHRFSLPLSLKCLKSNTHACRFYERLGWQARQEGVGPDGVYILYYLYNHTASV